MLVRFKNTAKIIAIVMLSLCSVLIAQEKENNTEKLYNQPSIVVFPLDIDQDDAEHRHLGMIITESIINTLSKIPQLLVIAGTTDFQSQSLEKAVQQIGARFILTGTLQSAGEHLQVTMTLGDSENTKSKWTEVYNVELKDLLHIPDAVIPQVLTALKIDSAEVSLTTPTKSLEAYRQFLYARELLQRFNKQDNTQAQTLFQKALELDPKFGLAQTYLGWSYLLQARNHWVNDTDQARLHARQQAEQTLAIDPNHVDALILAAQFPLDKGEPEEAIVLLRKAVSLNPNHVNAAAILGVNLAYRGYPKEAKEQLKKAIFLNPNHPAWYLWALGIAYYIEGDYNQAIATFERYYGLNPKDFEIQIDLAYAYAQTGQFDKARSAIQQALQDDPSYTLARFSDKFGPRYKDPTIVQSILANLRKAGLPE